MDEFDEISELIKKDVVADAAYNENGFRRKLSNTLLRKMKKLEITEKDLIEKAKIKKSELNRLLHKEIGGRVSLTTIFRVCHVLKLKFTGNILQVQK